MGNQAHPVVFRLVRLATGALAVVGACVVLACVWFMLGHGSPLMALVTESDAPAPAQVIVCLTGGLASHALPTAEGWDRVYTAVQLQADGLAPAIVFSGGGTEQVSEAEVYAEAARWFGCPPAAIVLDPIPGSTAEHPNNLLRIAAGSPPAPIARHTALLVVTSAFHSKRAAMCFRKAGFLNVRLITSYEAGRSGVARGQLRSSVSQYKPSGKTYGDPLNRVRWGLNDTLTAIRELAGIAVYRWRGQV